MKGPGGFPGQTKAVRATAADRHKGPTGGGPSVPFSNNRATDFTKDSDLIGVFLSQSKRFAREPLLWRKVDGAFKSISWGEV
jgi:hypothetical protein